MQAIVVDFMVASIDWKNSNYRLPSGMVESEFQRLVEESKKVRAPTKEQEIVARLLEEARPLDQRLLSKAKVADFGLTQQNQNFTSLKLALEGLMKEIQASELKI